MNFKESTPIFIQISNRLCDEILQDKFLENERVPSVREYSGLIEVNVNTVMRSYDYLQQIEIIYNKRGIGYFVAQGAKDIIMQIRHKKFISNTLPEVFKQMETLSISINEFTQYYEKYKQKEL